VGGEEQSQGGDGFLATTQVVHGLETFAGRHTIVVDTIQIWFLGIIGSNVGLGCLITSQFLVDTIDGIRDVLTAGNEARGPLVLDPLKCSLGLLGLFTRVLELLVGGLHFFRYGI